MTYIDVIDKNTPHLSVLWQTNFNISITKLKAFDPESLVDLLVKQDDFSNETGTTDQIRDKKKKATTTASAESAGMTLLKPAIVNFLKYVFIIGESPQSKR